MKPSGFSLVELLVVIALFSLLMALAIMPFGTMNRRSAIERQITEMYQDIVRAQQQAMQTRSRYRVTFNPNTLIITRLTGDIDTGLPDTVVLTKALPVAINTSLWASPNATDIIFNTKGIMIDPWPKSICIQSNVGPKVDSLVIVQTQISLGQNQGAGCASPNIIKK